MISQRSIQEVIETARIEDVIQDYLELKKRGSNLIGLCPFHNEKTPSFTVNPARNIYKCFGCGEGGNTVSFLMEHDSLSFPESIRHLASKYNITLEETIQTSEEKEKDQQKESLYIVNEYAKSFFSDQMFETEIGRNIGLGYFKQRGYRESTIKAFGLGYIANKTSDLTRAAIEKGFKIEQLRAVGLTNQYDKDFFRDRVMFTIFNVTGKVIGFAGRTLSQDKKVPKYVNTPETEIYNKRKTLYGLHVAKGPIRKSNECILVEGYTDVITLYQNGIQNTVAASGTSLTEGQARMIKRYTDNVKFIFDGDAAGVKAAMRGIDIVLAQNLNVRIVILPDGEDPDGSLKKMGSDGFKEFIDSKSDDFILFKTKFLLKETKNDPIRRSMVTKNIVKSISLIPDMLNRSIYIQECSKIMQLDEQVLINELNKTIHAQVKSKQVQSNFRKEAQNIPSSPIIKDPFLGQTTDKKLDGDIKLEYTIAALLIKYGDQFYDDEENTLVCQFVLHNIDEVAEFIRVPLYKKIIFEYASALKLNKEIVPNYFIFHEDKEVAKFAADIFSQKYVYSSNWEDKHGIQLNTQKSPDFNFRKDAENSVLRFKLKKMDQLIEENKKTIIEIEKDPEQFERVLLLSKVHSELMLKRQELSKLVRQVIL